MFPKNALIAFLFLASPVWSQQQVAATVLQTPHKLVLTPTLARVSGPGPMALRDRTPYLTPGPGDLERPGQTPGTYIHNPQGASSPILVAVAADTGVPFKGSLEGHETILPISPQFLSSLLKGTGNATQLGSFTVIKMDIVNLVTSTDLGSLAFTAANGDILTADFTGYASPTVTPGVLSVVETAFISGGAGRFAGATGSFIVTRSFDLAHELYHRFIRGDDLLSRRQTRFAQRGGISKLTHTKAPHLQAQVLDAGRSSGLTCYNVIPCLRRSSTLPRKTRVLLEGPLLMRTAMLGRSLALIFPDRLRCGPGFNGPRVGGVHNFGAVSWLSQSQLQLAENELAGCGYRY